MAAAAADRCCLRYALKITFADDAVAAAAFHATL